MRLNLLLISCRVKTVQVNTLPAQLIQILALSLPSLTTKAAPLCTKIRFSKCTLHVFHQRLFIAVSEGFKKRYLRLFIVKNFKAIRSWNAMFSFPWVRRPLNCAKWTSRKENVTEQRFRIKRLGTLRLRGRFVVYDKIRIWHLEVGFFCALNDSTILNRSPFFLKYMRCS